MTEIEYRNLVLDDFDEKLATGELPIGLVSSTRRSLKDQCIHACTERFDKKDTSLLKLFFGDKENQMAYLIAIKNTSAEDFRTLNNFLNDRSIHTSFDNICLLAWMIDFNPRPYHPGLEVPKAKDEKPKPLDSDPTSKPEDEEEGEEPPPPPVPPSKPRNRILVGAIALSGLLIIMVLLKEIAKPNLTGREKCMVWLDDHFEPVECAESRNQNYVYPIDSILIENFKRNTRQDTLTAYSAKKVWWSLHRGKANFYTYDAKFDPLDTNKRLRPASAYIIKKYATKPSSKIQLILDYLKKIF